MKEIKLIQNYNDVYKKTVKINNIYMKAYLDTGSQVNVLTTQVADLLSLYIIPTNIVLKGFSGGFVTSRGAVEFVLEIDGLEMPCKAYLTEINMNGVNLLLGQPTINQDGISLVVHSGSATIRRDCDFWTR